MFQSITCLVFILTSSVMAQAASFPSNSGAVHLQMQKWVATHMGETEIDGLPVMAELEESTLGSEIPDMMAGAGDTLVPSLTPVVKKAYRLNLIVSHNPRIQAVYMVTPRIVSLDGSLHRAFVSAAEDTRGFQFTAVTENDGQLHVSYTRKLPDGNSLQGEFSLAPLLTN